MGHRTMPDERVQARVAGQDLPGRARRRVAVEHDSNIFAQAGKHAPILTFPSESLKYWDIRIASRVERAIPKSGRPGNPKRHSREGGNPLALLTGAKWIPAVAGMTSVSRAPCAFPRSLVPHLFQQLCTRSSMRAS